MKDTKRQILPVGLWVIATPIGNLSDLSQRVQDALTTAPVLLCEDTRKTMSLLAALKIPLAGKRLERLDQHTPKARLLEYVQRLKQEPMGLVTDAGTPCLSDPGAELIRLAQAEKIQITPLPGPSSIMTFLSAAGFRESSFLFRGFFPKKEKEQLTELKNMSILLKACKTFIWLESPLRILKSIKILARYYPNAQCVVAKELTKFNEKYFLGNTQSVLQEIQEEIEREGMRGEWIFGVEIHESISPQDLQIKENLWISLLEFFLESNISVSVASKKLSHLFDIPKKEIYTKALEILKIKNLHHKKSIDP